MEDKKPMVFIASNDDKRLAGALCNKFIDMLESHDIGFKAYVLQMLLDSFEETYDIDIKNGMAITDNTRKQEG